VELARHVTDDDTEAEGSFDLQRLMSELPEEQLLSTVVEMLKVEIGEILRMAPDKVDAARPVQEMGLDSLMGVELAVAVEGRFGTRLPIMVLSDGPTVTKLATYIIAQLRGDEAASKGETEADATRAQIERVASQHAADLPAAAEIERTVSNLRAGIATASRRLVK
jgi:acyl carrier protein